jgi:C4-dicarboxylate-specific signal transduction histidine kinase
MEELRKTQSQLIHSEKMASLGQMTSGIAHEINNPLNFISGGVEGLKYSIEQLFAIAKTSDAEVDELEKETRKLIDSISNGVYRANKITTSLRTFSSPHSSTFTSIEITESIEVALTMLNNKIAMHRIEVIKEYTSASTLIMGNSSELSQVFGNIIDNAIQAMELVSGSRKLFIRTLVKNECLIVKITDSGSGIPQEIKERIFEPFFTTKEAGKGTGLGLSISYGIIEEHNAKITFGNKLGGGTEFILSFKAIES